MTANFHQYFHAAIIISIISELSDARNNVVTLSHPYLHQRSKPISFSCENITKSQKIHKEFILPLPIIILGEESTATFCYTGSHCLWHVRGLRPIPFAPFKCSVWLLHICTPYLIPQSMPRSNLSPTLPYSWPYMKIARRVRLKTCILREQSKNFWHIQSCPF